MIDKSSKKCQCGSRNILFVDQKNAYCELCVPVAGEKSFIKSKKKKTNKLPESPQDSDEVSDNLQ